MPKPLLYGFLQHRDAMNVPITDAMVPVVQRAITATLDEYNRVLNALMGLFCMDTTQFKFRYRTPAAKKLQQLDENGRARPTSGTGYYDVAFPIFAAGDAWGANFVTQQKMTMQVINDWLYDTLTADRNWMSHSILRALLADRPWTYDDDTHGELSILPLANGDTQTYLIRKGFAAGSTDNHLLAQLDPISDAHNPFPRIRRGLTEHAENGGENADVVVLAPYDQMESIMGLAGFHDIRDVNIQPGGNEAVLTGTLNVPVPGVLRGRVNNTWAVEWATMPEDYLLAVPTGAGGDQALARRQHAEASLQGLIELPVRQDTPYTERQFQRHEGHGVMNRVGGLAMQIGTDTYQAPEGYKAPVTG